MLLNNELSQPDIDTDAIIASKKANPDMKPPIQYSNYYFAAVAPEEIAEELQAKVDEYYNYITSSNQAELWRRSYRAYYGMRQSEGSSGWGVFDVGSLIASGDQGEIVRVKVNHFSNLIQHQLALAIGNRPALECRARNSDAQSLISAMLGDGIVEYFMRERKIERNYFMAIETASALSEGYIVLGWDPNAGKQYGVGPNGAILYDGDLIAKNFTPFQVIKDVTKNSDGDQKWYITHDKKNRFDLMAKYPHLADKIDKVSNDATTSNRNFSDPSKMIATTSFGTQESDDVPYYEFYHEKSDALPNGRYTIFIDGDIKLFDGPLPFREVPVYRVAPKNIIGTPFGWTPAFDILGIQELCDKLYTVVSSNVLGSGLNNFLWPPKKCLNFIQLPGGRNLIESMVKPEVLALLSTPAEVYNYINKVESIMEIIMGVSPVNRGDLPSNDLSGSALAFMAAQAVTFNSELQASANQLLESIGTGMIYILQDFAATPRMAIIAGKQNRPLMKTFTGEDLKGVNNVVCDATSPISKTTAGKISIADNLLKAGMIKTPQEYLTLIKTGNAEPMTRGPIMENFLIQQENEWLLEGKQVQALRIDNHAQHIEEHKTLLSTPASRQDPQLVQTVLAHIQEHEQQQFDLQQNDPAYLAATQQQPLPFPQPQQPIPQPQGGQPPNGASGGISATVNPQGIPSQESSKIKQPRMPSLPKGADPQTQASFAQLQQRQG